MVVFLRSFLLLCALYFAGLSGELPKVLVSAAPYKFFVDKIADGTVQVELMVPAGASMHTYEPTPRQMLAASQAVIWFQMGETFEVRASQALRSHHPDIKFVDLRKGVDLIVDSEASCHCCQHAQDSCVDPHIWLSPRQVKIQAKTIADALSEAFPQNLKRYAEKLNLLLGELDRLDHEIEAKLAPLKNRTIMVSHPAYAYFCRDYHLEQLSIEFEGKDPTPKQLTKILTLARQSRIAKIFIQPQYNNKGAQLIAHEIGARVVPLDPYAENYFDSMREIAVQFAER